MEPPSPPSPPSRVNPFEDWDWVWVRVPLVTPVVSWVASLYQKLRSLGAHLWTTVSGSGARGNSEGPGANELDPSKSILGWQNKLDSAVRRPSIHLLLLGERGAGQQKFAEHFFRDSEHSPVLVHYHAPPLDDVAKYLQNLPRHKCWVVCYIIPASQALPPFDFKKIVKLVAGKQLPLVLVRNNREAAEEEDGLDDIRFGTDIPAFLVSDQIPGGGEQLMEWFSTAPNVDRWSLMLAMRQMDAAKERLLAAYLRQQLTLPAFPFDETVVTLALTMCGSRGNLAEELRTAIKSVRQQGQAAAAFEVIDEVAMCLTLVHNWHTAGQADLESMHSQLKSKLQLCVGGGTSLADAAALALHSVLVAGPMP